MMGMAQQLLVAIVYTKASWWMNGSLVLLLVSLPSNAKNRQRAD